MQKINREEGLNLPDAPPFAIDSGMRG